MLQLFQVLGIALFVLLTWSQCEANTASPDAAATSSCTNAQSLAEATNCQSMAEKLEFAIPHYSFSTTITLSKNDHICTSLRQAAWRDYVSQSQLFVGFHGDVHGIGRALPEKMGVIFIR